jgi:hypothetical protein
MLFVIGWFSDAYTIDLGASAENASFLLIWPRFHFV